MMSFKKFWTAKIGQKKKVAHHLERRHENEVVDEQLERERYVGKKADKNSRKSKNV